MDDLEDHIESLELQHKVIEEDQVLLEEFTLDLQRDITEIDFRSESDEKPRDKMFEAAEDTLSLFEDLKRKLESFEVSLKGGMDDDPQRQELNGMLDAHVKKILQLKQSIDHLSV